MLLGHVSAVTDNLLICSGPEVIAAVLEAKSIVEARHEFVVPQLRKSVD